MIKSRRVRWTGNVVQMGKKRNAYRILVPKPGEKRPIGRLECWWKNNIKLNVREIGCGSMDRIDLAQNRNQWRALVNTIMNLRVP
jgi:hypothetical protein